MMRDDSTSAHLFQLMSKLHDIVYLMKMEKEGFSYVQVTEEARKAASLPADVAGKTFEDVYPEREAAHLTRQYEKAVFAEDVTFFSDRMNVLYNADRYASTILLPVHEREGDSYVLGITSDLKSGVAAELLETIGMYDYLTGLPNLLKIKQDAGRMLVEEGHLKVRTVYFDIDSFKLVNATIGIEKSNDILKEIVEKVSKVISQDSILGRMDGDEFVLIGMMSTSEAVLVSETILDVISGISYEVEGEDIYLSSCAGISGEASEVDDMISQASIAMRQAKRDGKNNVSIFKETNYISEQLNESVLEKELEHALENGEFDVFYQPKLNVIKEEVSYEALARWFSSKLGTVSPGVFIPLAEKSRLIEKITKRVFEKVCQDILHYKEEFRNRRVAVNLSANMFHKTMLEDTLLSVIEGYGIHPEAFELEITESAIMEDPDQARDIIDHLRALGFRVVIDDFGASYSSLNYLKQFSIDGIKIDQSFIRELKTDIRDKDYEIVKMIITLARKLHLSVTAEGVEKAGHYDVIKRLKADELQGYFISKPMAAASLEGVLSSLASMFSFGGDCISGKSDIDEGELRRLGELHRLNLEGFDFSERYDRIVEIVSRTFSVPTAILSLLTKDQQVYKSSVGLPELFAELGGMEIENSTCGGMIETEKPLVLPDLNLMAEERYKYFVREYGYQFYAGVPLITKNGEIIGSLCILDTDLRKFDDTDVQLLEEYADWVMTEIEMQDYLKETNRRQQAMEDIYRTIVKDLPVEERIEQVLRSFLEWSHYTGAFFYMGERECHLTRSGRKDIDPGVIKSLAKQSIEEGYHEEREGDITISNSLKSSILDETSGTKVGGFFLYTLPGEYTAVKEPVVIRDIVSQLAVIGGWAANEWEKEKREKEISCLVYRDSLTGLWNRKAFREDTEKKLSKQEPFTILFIDIDNFKVINDTWGHLIGDEVLQTIARRLAKETDGREAEAYRLAGDGFLLVFVEENGLNTCPEQLLEAIRTPVMTSEGEVCVSASLGLYTSTEEQPESIDEVMKKADEAMFLKKSMGGNGGEVYSR
ncbi:EAL domain-containing protein [Salimicrobium flavidum]|uniref:Diguanylate cyclase (GGDEF) domain-containing protein n=1 Tax=Salimicrobium flavidum TaxID=570947 RepID=A0A1N7K9B0_9BACI|nr:EAL domain-containing protein [Salimicrobium flavidum]SIS58120.1 diguanylate cyclase (GGDEF) domain-containing protein [Salimicrobium flavidum]